MPEDAVSEVRTPPPSDFGQHLYLTRAFARRKYNVGEADLNMTSEEFVTKVRVAPTSTVDSR
jgi:hypothetical protein